MNTTLADALWLAAGAIVTIAVVSLVVFWARAESAAPPAATPAPPMKETDL